MNREREFSQCLHLYSVPHHQNQIKCGHPHLSSLPLLFLFSSSSPPLLLNDTDFFQGTSTRLSILSSTPTSTGTLGRRFAKPSATTALTVLCVAGASLASAVVVKVVVVRVWPSVWVEVRAKTHPRLKSSPGQPLAPSTAILK